LKIPGSNFLDDFNEKYSYEYGSGNDSLQSYRLLKLKKIKELYDYISQFLIEGF